MWIREEYSRTAYAESHAHATLCLPGNDGGTLRAGRPRIEDLKGKTVLLFTPHPDDDAFCCGGTLARMVEQGNKVRVVIYTNDDKGSYDPEMTSERLARIRKAEEEEGNRIIGIPKENLIWLGHHDGMLEYVDSKRLVEQATEIIRRYRPDIVMTVDPGADSVDGTSRTIAWRP